MEGNDQASSKTIAVRIRIDRSSIDEMERKAQRLCGIMQEAKTLADDLASTDATISIEPT